MAGKLNPLEELLLQALETERGGIGVYEAAIACAVNDALREEWSEYLDETRRHEQVLRQAIEALGFDPEKETPGRAVVRHQGESLVEAMAMAKEAGGRPEAAELVAAECVVLAETKDHQNWQLIGRCAEALGGDRGQALKAAYDEVEDDEDHHLYHSRGWCRELWIAFLGMPAVLPPPEEVKHVETEIGAAKAYASREMLLGRTPQQQRR